METIMLWRAYVAVGYSSLYQFNVEIFPHHVVFAIFKIKRGNILFWCVYAADVLSFKTLFGHLILKKLFSSWVCPISSSKVAFDFVALDHYSSTITQIFIPI